MPPLSGRRCKGAHTPEGRTAARLSKRGISMAQTQRPWLPIAGFAIGVAAATPAPAERHAVAGHFSVPGHGAVVHRSGDPNNAIANPGFETGSIDGGWYQCGDSNSYATREHPFSGRYDEYSGTASGNGEPAGNSGVCQQVTVPPGGMLAVRLYQLSDEADTTFAFQEGYLLDDRGNVVLRLYKSVNDAAAWVLGTWNLGAYAGRTYWLYFGVHGDGDPRHSTQQFVDDVRLTSAGAAAPK